MSLSRTKLVSPFISSSLPSELNSDWDSYATKKANCSFKCWLTASNYFTIIAVWGGSASGIVLAILGHMRLRPLDLAFSHTAVDPTLASLILHFLTFLLTIVAFSALIRHNTGLLYLVCIGAAFLFVGHAGASVYTYHYVQAGPDIIPQLLRKAIVNFNPERNVREDESVDYVQQQFACCGSMSFSDWRMNHHYSCDDVGDAGFSTTMRCGVPASCCRHITHPTCGEHVQPLPQSEIARLIYTGGCLQAVRQEYRSNYIYIATLSLCVGFALVICLLLTHTNIKEMQISDHQKRKEQKLRMKVHKIYEET